MARVGPVSDEERRQLIQKSGLLGKYETAIDRHSAFEELQERAGQTSTPAGPPAGGLLGSLGGAWRAFRQNVRWRAPAHVDGRNRPSLGGSSGRAHRRDEDRASHLAGNPGRQAQIDPPDYEATLSSASS
jgi:Bacterial protein of unknown function (DUF853)